MLFRKERENKPRSVSVCGIYCRQHLEHVSYNRQSYEHLSRNGGEHRLLEIFRGDASSDRFCGYNFLFVAFAYFQKAAFGAALRREER